MKVGDVIHFNLNFVFNIIFNFNMTFIFDDFRLRLRVWVASTPVIGFFLRLVTYHVVGTGDFDFGEIGHLVRSVNWGRAGLGAEVCFWRRAF